MFDYVVIVPLYSILLLYDKYVAENIGIMSKTYLPCRRIFVEWLSLITTLSASCCNRWMVFPVSHSVQDNHVMNRYFYICSHKTQMQYLLISKPCFLLKLQLLQVLLPLLKNLSQERDVRPALHEKFHMTEWFQKHGIPASFWPL